MTLAVVDTGPLLAAVDADDKDHTRCVEALASPGMRLILPALAVTEVCQLLGKRRGAGIEAAFLATLVDYDVRAPAHDDWSRISELVRRYADFPLGGVGASVVAMAERLQTDTIITLDKRHFAAIKPRHCRSFRLLPE
ncbi:MAG: type II toxin-antitoxin system VapC family toxin [Chloroflexota bacterium]